MADAFDVAWDIAKKDDDYSKFGEKFAERMKQLKEGGRGLPEGTKFSDLRSTDRPLMPEGMREGPQERSGRDADGNFSLDRLMIRKPQTKLSPGLKSFIRRTREATNKPPVDFGETEEFES